LLLNTLLFSTTALIPMPVLSWLKNSPQRIPHTHTVTDRSELIFDLVVFGTWSLSDLLAGCLAFSGLNEFGSPNLHKSLLGLPRGLLCGQSADAAKNRRYRHWIIREPSTCMLPVELSLL
jgi:hypothetical protein